MRVGPIDFQFLEKVQEEVGPYHADFFESDPSLSTRVSIPLHPAHQGKYLAVVVCLVFVALLVCLALLHLHLRTVDCQDNDVFLSDVQCMNGSSEFLLT